MSKLTLEEKRLKILRNQLFGKEPLTTEKVKVVPQVKAINQITNSANLTSNKESTYLRNDLLRIFLLTTLALSLEFILYFSLQNRLISFKF